MAYQNVGTPRFYVCIMSYLKAIGDFRVGIDEDENISTANLLVDGGTEDDLFDLIGINPSNVLNLIRNPDVGVTYDYLKYQIPSGVHFSDIMPNDKNFGMILGHNLASADGTYYIQQGGGDYDSVATENYLNYSGRIPQYNGFSISIENNAHDLDHRSIQFRIETLDDAPDYLVPLKIGSLLYGTYFDMPFAPDLDLSMEREYGSTKELTTYNGSSISNTMWTKPPQWGDLGAWELLDPEQNSYPQFSRSGRRVWNLTFSYMDDADVFSPNQSLNSIYYTHEGLSSEDYISANNNQLIVSGLGAFSTTVNSGSASFGSVTYNGFTSDLAAITQTTITSGNFELNAGELLQLSITYKVTDGGFINNPANTATVEGCLSTDGSSGTWQYAAESGASSSFVTVVRDFEVIHSNATATLTIRQFSNASGLEAEYKDISLNKMSSASGSDNGFRSNLLTDNNFFSQVWHKTLGGTLPFIFQPDKDNKNPDQFAICKIKENSLKATQSAFNVYDISMTIEEGW